MVLPDTSVWVDFSRRGAKGAAAAMRDLLNRGEIATCGPVAAELLSGAANEVSDRMWATLSSLPWAELTSAAWRDVGTVGYRLRQVGQTLPLTDVAIAVAAARGGYALWSLDGDFERMAPVLEGLELYEP